MYLDWVLRTLCSNPQSGTGKGGKIEIKDFPPLSFSQWSMDTGTQMPREMARPKGHTKRHAHILRAVRTKASPSAAPSMSKLFLPPDSDPEPVPSGGQLRLLPALGPPSSEQSRAEQPYSPRPGLGLGSASTPVSGLPAGRRWESGEAGLLVLLGH